MPHSHPVALHAGARIETAPCWAAACTPASPSTRGRGSKLGWDKVPTRYLRRPPRGGADRNIDVTGVGSGVLVALHAGARIETMTSRKADLE